MTGTYERGRPQTGSPTVNVGTVGPTVPNSPETDQRARLAVCSFADNAADARHLLEVLDLLPVGVRPLA